MSKLVEHAQDVMQVCRNGHVITDRLRSCPERALSHDLPGALVVPGLHPVGAGQPPRCCSTCGAAFPWTRQARPPKREALVILDHLLRRLPRVIRELRVRHADRPPFRVTDERDLEDLVRALLPLHFDDIRPESRTPSYAAVTRTDFLLASEGIAVTVKFAPSSLVEQLREDVEYYQRQRRIRVLVVYVHDPETSLREPHLLPALEGSEELEVRCVVGTP
jgi:hypothetical protein